MLDRSQWLAIGLVSGFAYILGKDRESFEAERETCYYCENRGHDSGGLCTECNKSWFGPHRKTILGKHDAESFEAEEFGAEKDWSECVVCKSNKATEGQYETIVCHDCAYDSWGRENTPIKDRCPSCYDSQELWVGDWMRCSKCNESMCENCETENYQVCEQCWAKDEIRASYLRAESFDAEKKNGMELILADGGWEGSMVLSGDEDAIKYIIKQTAFGEEYRPDIGMPEEWDMGGEEWLDQWFEDNDLETIAQETGWTITRVSSNAVFWGNRKGIIVADETWWGAESDGITRDEKGMRHSPHKKCPDCGAKPTSSWIDPGKCECGRVMNPSEYTNIRFSAFGADEDNFTEIENLLDSNDDIFLGTGDGFKPDHPNREEIIAYLTQGGGGQTPYRVCFTCSRVTPDWVTIDEGYECFPCADQ